MWVQISVEMLTGLQVRVPTPAALLLGPHDARGEVEHTALRVALTAPSSCFRACARRAWVWLSREAFARRRCW